MTSQHTDLTRQHKDLTRRHKDPTRRHNYLTSDCRSMPPYENYRKEIFYISRVLNMRRYTCINIFACIIHVYPIYISSLLIRKEIKRIPGLNNDIYSY